MSLAVVAAAAIGWASLYAGSLPLLTPKSLGRQSDRVYFASSVVSILHALYTGLSAAYLLYSGELPLWESFGRPSAAWERVVAISMGYFLYDGTLVLLHAMPGRTEMLLHHSLGLATQYAPICVYHNFHAISCMGYIAELSTPFVCARWMLKEAGGGSGTRLYLLNGLAIVLSFFVFRVVGLLVCLYQVFVLVPRHASPSFSDLGPFGPHLVGTAALGFYALNLFWFYKIVAGALKLVAAPSEPKKGAKGAAADGPSPLPQQEAYPVDKTE